MANHPKTVVIVDGENLAIRYKAMIKDGYEAKNNVIYVKDIFVWSPDLFQRYNTMKDILRISYFTCITGDDVILKQLNDKISKIEYSYTVDIVGGGGGNSLYTDGLNKIVNTGTLNPRLFKKQKGQPSKKIDIAMVIDAFNYSILDGIDEIHIMSGDADFIPVLQEIMRRGKKVAVSSFSSGVNDEMKHIPDTYHCLDDIFLTKKKKQD